LQALVLHLLYVLSRFKAEGECRNAFVPDNKSLAVKNDTVVVWVRFCPRIAIADIGLTGQTVVFFIPTMQQGFPSVRYETDVQYIWHVWMNLQRVGR
jgi:hypothetical protein